jgi:hypothetical protein
MRGGVRRSPINGVHVINLRPSEPPLRARHPRTLPTDSQAVGENVRVTPCSMPRDSIWARVWLSAPWIGLPMVKPQPTQRWSASVRRLR